MVFPLKSGPPKSMDIEPNEVLVEYDPISILVSEYI
jgi:hypothetical protein